MIKVTHLITVGTGGAYKAVERMSEAMNELQSVSSTVLLRNKVFEDTSGEVFLDSPVKEFVSKSKNVINKLFASGNVTRDLLGSSVGGNEAVKNADVIIVHWINSFLSYRTFKEIIELGKPVVIFAHDMWHMTGGCHNNGDCTEYTKECGICPQTRKGSKVAHRNFVTKKKLYSSSNVSVVIPGNDYLKRACVSGILGSVKKTCIFNCLDTHNFKPVSTSGMRERYGLKDNLPVVMFCADNAGVKNPNKGFDILSTALSEFKPDEIQLLAVGNIDENYIKNLGFTYSCTGFVHDDGLMASMYSMATVNVVPSLQESFCYSACESLACGTPVVSFEVGGLKDQIIHGKNGYFAKFRNSHDLAEGIRYCIDNYDTLSPAAVSDAQRFSYENIGKSWLKYLEGLEISNE